MSYFRGDLFSGTCPADQRSGQVHKTLPNRYPIGDQFQAEGGMLSYKPSHCVAVISIENMIFGAADQKAVHAQNF
jgi:hypothetical protein